METPPKPQQYDLVRFLGKTFTYLGMIEPLACIASEGDRPLLVYCRPEDLRLVEKL
jgi:hypothetical protein